MFVSAGISGMVVSCNRIQRTSLSLHVHPAGHSLASTDDDKVNKKYSATIIFTQIIFVVKLSVDVYILISTVGAL